MQHCNSSSFDVVGRIPKTSLDNAFTWDSHMACILSRPRMMNLDDCTATSPAGCHIPPNRITSVPHPMSSTSKPPLFANRLFSYALSLKSPRDLFSHANKRSVSDYSIMGRLHSEVIAVWDAHHPALCRKKHDTTWDESHPIVKRQREYAKILANSVILTLHRDHAPIHEESFGMATTAAFDSLEAQGKLYLTLPPNQQRVYGLSCHCIDSCIFIAYAVTHLGKTDRETVERAFVFR